MEALSNEERDSLVAQRDTPKKRMASGEIKRIFVKAETILDSMNLVKAAQVGRVKESQNKESWELEDFGETF